MTPFLVVDCSFIMSSLLPDEDMVKYDLSGFHIYVPALFYLECTDVLNVAFKRKRISENNFHEYIKVLSLLPFQVDHFSARSESIYSITTICRKYDLSSYDASYLDLAIRLNAFLGTRDNKLISATHACGLATL